MAKLRSFAMDGITLIFSLAIGFAAGWGTRDYILRRRRRRRFVG
jgi:hypothetical protein